MIIGVEVGRVQLDERTRLSPSRNRSRTRDYVRGLLVEHGILPRRDELRVRYQEWATEALTRLTDEANRDILERYVRWQHLRRMNQMETVPHGTFLRSKQTVTVAINFVNWLHERGVTLEDLQQSDVDAWVAGWADHEADRRPFPELGDQESARTQRTNPKHRRGTSKKLSAADQETALTEVIDGGDLSSRDRAAAILILVFGQQIEDVVALTWEDVSVTMISSPSHSAASRSS